MPEPVFCDFAMFSRFWSHKQSNSHHHPGPWIRCVELWDERLARPGGGCNDELALPRVGPAFARGTAGPPERFETRKPRAPVSLAHPMRIAVIPGDGIGKDVTAEALKVLDAVTSRFGRRLEVEHLPWSADYYLESKVTIPAGRLRPAARLRRDLHRRAWRSPRPRQSPRA